METKNLDFIDKIAYLLVMFTKDGHEVPSFVGPSPCVMNEVFMRFRNSEVDKCGSEEKSIWDLHKTKIVPVYTIKTTKDTAYVRKSE
jgi:hypothetical protein